LYTAAPYSYEIVYYRSLVLLALKCAIPKDIDVLQNRPLEVMQTIFFFLREQEMLHNGKQVVWNDVVSIPYGTSVVDYLSACRGRGVL
jgi:hypothetical protein